MATEIRTSSSADEEAAGLLTDCCGICEKQFAKYTCPRCNVRYCSLDCYKRESHAQCSELFYKNCFMEALKEKSVSPEEKRQMLEMLKRIESTHTDDLVDDTSDEDDPSLEERLASLNLDVAEPDTIWECLNDGERREFQRLLQTGEMADSIALHTPWWERAGCIRALVEVVGDEGGRTNTNVPDVMGGIPPLGRLLKATPPAVQLKYNAVSILYSYCYIVRLYNGDHMDMAVEAAQTVLDLCPVLAHNVSYNDVSEVVHHCVHTCQQHNQPYGSSEYSTSALLDVTNILMPVTATTGRASSSNDFTLAALSDLYRIFEAAVRDTKKTVAQAKQSRTVVSHMELKRSLQMATRKLYFFLSYVASNTDDVASLAMPVKLELESIRSKVQEHKLVQSKIEKQRDERKCGHGTKRLIEEVT
ncbi:zinc finger HIT domain-containing protein 2-like [Corticium candelabrum]|uniref:zinc finger HIT domain-containing protein 2-like n=1 Tax=Corticium candelabrum TaxID=121492 RepID=UPI002E26EE34|nr:zinc finger HIT domain-containing protein 2-like [Corticium candelabrum]